MSNFFFKFKQMPLYHALRQLSEDIVKASNEPNFEKAKNYSDHFAEILLFIFGVENHAESSWMERVYQAEAKTDPESHEGLEVHRAEFEMLTEILSPPFNPSVRNLFTFALSNFHPEKHYEFEVKRLPQHTQYLLDKRRFESPNLLAYFGFLELGKAALSSDGKRLILSIFELYLLVFISSMRNFIGKNYVDLKTPEDYFRDDFELEFLHNPYLVLVRRYLEFFFAERKHGKHGKTFKALIFLLEDFTINDFIPSQIATTQRTYSQKPGAFGPSVLNNKGRVPKPHIFQAIYLVVHYFLRNNDAEPELKKNDFLANSCFFAKSLYYFLLNVLEAWNQDINNSANLLSFLGRVWVQFLKPWEVNESYCLVNILNRYDAGKPFEIQDFAATVKEFRVSKEFGRKENAQFISHFLKENVLFYTHVLAQFLITLSDQNEIHFKDLVFLKGLMDFLLGPGNQKGINSLFNGFINVNWMKQLATDGNAKIEGSLVVMQYLEYMGAKQHNLNLFNDDTLISRVLKIVANLTRFIENFKKKKSTAGVYTFLQRKNPEFDTLVNVSQAYVESIASQLFLLFSIEANSIYQELNQNSENELVARKHIKKTPNKHTYLCWETPLGPKESQLLFDFYINLAKLIDYCLRRRNLGYNNTFPVTNLRVLADPNNSVKALLVLAVIMLVFYLALQYLANAIF